MSILLYQTSPLSRFGGVSFRRSRSRERRYLVPWPFFVPLERLEKLLIICRFLLHTSRRLRELSFRTADLLGGLRFRVRTTNAGLAAITCCKPPQRTPTSNICDSLFAPPSCWYCLLPPPQCFLPRTIETHGAWGFACTSSAGWFKTPSPSSLDLSSQYPEARHQHHPPTVMKVQPTTWHPGGSGHRRQIVPPPHCRKMRRGTPRTSSPASTTAASLGRRPPQRGRGL